MEMVGGDFIEPSTIGGSVTDTVIMVGNNITYYSIGVNIVSSADFILRSTQKFTINPLWREVSLQIMVVM